MISLRNEFFSRSDLPAIPLLIAPLLVHRAQFPFVRYIELFDFTSISNVNLSLDRKNKLHQLHTILLIVDNRLNEIPPNLNRQIVRIIRHFIWGLNQNVDFNRYPNNDNDDHDQDDRMDTEMTNLVKKNQRFCFFKRLKTSSSLFFSGRNRIDVERRLFSDVEQTIDR